MFRDLSWLFGRKVDPEKAYESAMVKYSEIAKRAFYKVCVEEGTNIPEGEKTELDWKNVEPRDRALFNLFQASVRDGMALERSINGES